MSCIAVCLLYTSLEGELVVEWVGTQLAENGRLMEGILGNKLTSEAISTRLVDFLEQSILYSRK